jgi:hypothetical protein
MESKEATNALDILMNALMNATNLNQPFSVVGSAENVLRGFIKANSIESTDNTDG